MIKENGHVFKILAQIKCLGPSPSGSDPLNPSFKTGLNIPDKSE